MEGWPIGLCEKGAAPTPFWVQFLASWTEKCRNIALTWCFQEFLNLSPQTLGKKFTHFDEQVVNQPPRHLQRSWKIAVWVPMMDEPWCPTSNRLNWQEKFRKDDWKRSVDNPICSLGLLTWEGLHLIHPWKLPCWSKVGKSLKISLESVCWWNVIPFGNMEVPKNCWPFHRWVSFSFFSVAFFKFLPQQCFSTYCWWQPVGSLVYPIILPGFFLHPTGGFLAGCLVAI